MGKVLALQTTVAIARVQQRRCGRPLATVTRLVVVVDRKALARAELRSEFRAFAAAAGCPSRLNDQQLDRLFDALDEFVADELRLKKASGCRGHSSSAGDVQ